MKRFVITDETVHAAFDTLESHAEPAAMARAMRERKEDERKAAKAKAFLHATGNVTERESQAILSDEYKSASEAYYEAVEADEHFRNQRSKCEAIIEAWRTCQSNFRAMGKVA
jgi:Arc/MetJ-type ribon-helix-helix transcriptional regulator